MSCNSLKIVCIMYPIQKCSDVDRMNRRFHNMLTGQSQEKMDYLSKSSQKNNMLNGYYIGSDGLHHKKGDYSYTKYYYPAQTAIFYLDMRDKDGKISIFI